MGSDEVRTLLPPWRYNAAWARPTGDGMPGCRHRRPMKLLAPGVLSLKLFCDKAIDGMPLSLLGSSGATCLGASEPRTNCD